MGKKIEWTDIDFKGLIPALMSRRFDVAMSAIYITDERRKVVDFTDPYFAGGLVVLTKRAGPIKALKDLDGKKVSVQVGTKSVGLLKDNYPEDRAGRGREEPGDVRSGRDRPRRCRGDGQARGQGLSRRPRRHLHVLDEQLTTEEYGFAVRKDDARAARRR